MATTTANKTIEHLRAVFVDELNEQMLKHDELKVRIVTGVMCEIGTRVARGAATDQQLEQNVDDIHGFANEIARQLRSDLWL